MNAAWQDIIQGLTTASPLDQINLVLGVVGVGLMIRRSLLAFPVGLIAVTVQGVLFFRSRYYADATLQVFFFVALVYGWWHWTHPKNATTVELPVTRLTPRGLAVTVGIASVGTVGWALIAGRYTDSIMPFRDAFIAAFSVAAQVLQSRKQIENWPFWVVTNVVAICSYWAGGLYYTAFLYAVYLAMAFAGWKAWRGVLKEPALSTP